MAKYRDGSNFMQSNDPLFSRIFEPGEQVPRGGMCKCTGCGLEIGIAQFHRLPPQNHHQHSNYWTPIRWRLFVFHN